MRLRFLAPLLLLPVLAHAQMYRWVDDGGKVHYSDRAPSSGAKNMQKQSLSAGQGSSAALPYALQQAVGNFPVTLYTSEICTETCVQARELLNKRGVPYSEVTVTDEADLAQLKKLSGGNVVPVMTVGREVYKGFESGAYKAALDNAGYPTSSLLPPGVPARQPVPKPVRKAAPAAARAEGEPATAPQETAEPAAPK
ncbi:MAG: glutaredoxin family protein [Pseudomonadota bacterium]